MEGSVKIPEYKLRIMATTTFTEMNVGTDDAPKWYETKLYPAPYYDPENEGKPVLTSFRSSFKWTYKTLEYAEQGRLRVLQLLRDRHFTLTFEEGGGRLLTVNEHPAFDKARALLREVES